MKNYFLLSMMLTLACVFDVKTQCQAGFNIKRDSHDSALSTSIQIGSPQAPYKPLREILSMQGTSAKDKSKGGALAYISAVCGVAGLAIASPQTAAVMILLGLAAGLFGTAGLKKSKHNKFHRFLCYLGIVLGAILIVFGTIPILFLV